MSFFKRMFSADYRAAVSAEAAGDLDLAAERYAIAGQHDAAARMHLARAHRAETQAAQISALRDALHWVQSLPIDDDLYREVAGTLASALLTRAKSEGIATERDRQRVREAARLMGQAGHWEACGDAWELIGETQEAVNAFQRGGLVDRLETALGRDEELHDRSRTLRDEFAAYEMYLRSGQRNAARDALLRCVTVAEDKSDYRRLLDELDARIISGGRVVLRTRNQPDTTVCAKPTLALGRDALCDLVLRAGGVSRRHSEITVGSREMSPRFQLRDAGSRNGTLVGGMPIAGALPLSASGSFALGDAYTIDHEITGDPEQLLLRVVRGLEKGAIVVAGGDGEVMNLMELGHLPLSIRFSGGYPHFVHADPSVELQINGERLAKGDAQLIHGDQLRIADCVIEVL